MIPADLEAAGQAGEVGRRRRRRGAQELCRSPRARPGRARAPRPARPRRGRPAGDGAIAPRLAPARPGADGAGAAPGQPRVRRLASRRRASVSCSRRRRGGRGGAGGGGGRSGGRPRPRAGGGGGGGAAAVEARTRRRRAAAAGAGAAAARRDRCRGDRRAAAPRPAARRRRPAAAASRRIAERAPADPARSRAANRLSVGCVRRRHAPPADPVADPAAPVGQLAPAQRDAPERDVERPQQQREDEQPAATASVNRLVACEVVDPGLGRRRPARGRRSRRGSPPAAARSRPSSRYSAGVGATSPSVRPSGGEPGLVCVTRTAYAPLSSDVDRRLVHARRDLAEVDRRRLPGRARRARRWVA